MAGIRVHTGAKKIEVNDNGDFILLNLNDHDFPNRFFSMLDRIHALAETAGPKETVLRSEYPEGSIELVRALSELDNEVHRAIMEEVDGLFGPDTCRKVFGEIVPGVELFDDFFQQLLPYFEEFGKERAKRLSKYTAARTGNV